MNPTHLDLALVLNHGLDTLGQLEDFLRGLPVGAYSQRPFLVGASSIGAHVRHSLEHLDEFLDSTLSGTVDYDARARDSTIENDLSLALTRLEAGRRLWLSRLQGRNGDEVIELRAVTGTTSARAQMKSTLARECNFVTTHFVHHMALMAILAQLLNLETAADFGKAVSTLAHEQSLNRA